MRFATILLAILLSSFGGARAQSAQLLGTDSTTQGNWQGKYGADGYSIIGVKQSLPTYSTAIATGSAWTWAASSSDARALQNGASRIAACWYDSASFYFDVNLTDGASHQVSLYLLDWDGAGARKETVQITTTAGAVLASQPVAAFNNGVWLRFSVSGHVRLTVTNNGGVNAVASGIFFDSPSTGGGTTPPPLPPSNQHSLTINWDTVSGVTYNVYRNGSRIASAVTPPYKDLTIVQGATYSYSVSTVSNGTESNQAPVTQFIPWP